MPRVHLFESLRGLLAVWVIVHHAVLTSGLDSDRWPFPLSLFGQGGYAVDVFIILSGFVIFFCWTMKRKPMEDSSRGASSACIPCI